MKREDELEEEEYAEAVSATMGAMGHLSALPLPPVHGEQQPMDHAHVGWELPWALRARIAEVLCFGKCDPAALSVL